MLEDTGFTEVEIGPPVDTFGGASGEDKARAYEVYGYAFAAMKPDVRVDVARAHRAAPGR